MAQYGERYDEYGNPIRQTDEYGDPVHTGGTMGDYSNPYSSGTGTGAFSGPYGTGTEHHEQHHGLSGMLQRSGSSSSSSSVSLPIYLSTFFYIDLEKN